MTHDMVFLVSHAVDELTSERLGTASRTCIGFTRGLVAGTATDADDAAHRVLHSIWNEWGMSVLKEGE